MKDSNNKTFIVILVIAILIVGGIMYAVGKGQSSTSASANGPVTELADMKSLLNKLAPDFSLADKNGTVHKLSDLKGKSVVLFFNEGLMCYPACWSQMVQLSSDSRLNTSSVSSYSVVVDQSSNWGAAIAKMPELANANVLYDTDGNISKTYGMLKAGSSMHYGIYPGHSYVVIDPAGIVRYVFDDPKMAINNDLIAQEVQEIGGAVRTASTTAPQTSEN